jgi:hypothetical protein
MSVIDKSRFEARGGNGCSNSHYLLQRTTCCGSFAVEDIELQDLYVDPNDLRKTMMLLYDPGADSPPLCPFCKAEDWDMMEVVDVAAVRTAWQWAIERAMPTTPLRRL